MTAQMKRHPVQMQQGDDQESGLGDRKTHSTAKRGSDRFQVRDWANDLEGIVVPPARAAIGSRSGRERLERRPSAMACKVVLVQLARCANSNYECYPGLELLARRSCATVATVVAALNVLEELGLIVVTKRGGGAKQSNHYRICYPSELVQGDLVPEDELDRDDFELDHLASELVQGDLGSIKEAFRESFSPDSAATSPRKALQDRVTEAIEFHAAQMAEAYADEPEVYKPVVRRNTRRDHGEAITAYARANPADTAEDIVNAVLRRQALATQSKPLQTRQHPDCNCGDGYTTVTRDGIDYFEDCPCVANGPYPARAEAA